MMGGPAQSTLQKVILIGALIGLSACTDPPGLDSSVDPELEQARFPELVPFELITGPDRPDPEADAEITEQISARASGLQSRAQQLQSQTVIDEATRRRLEGGIATD